MADVWLYVLVSVGIVSLLSLIGVITLSIRKSNLERILIYFVGFSAGALLGDALIHLLPEAVRESGFGLKISLFFIAGIIVSFIVEKYIHWRHCHLEGAKGHVHPFAIMNLVGDSVHNFIDGIVIAASYLASIPIGIATTTAVVFHEIPHELGNFGVLLRGGYKVRRALLFNFLTALTSVLGAVIALVLAAYVKGFLIFLIPFAAGEFIYISVADLIPELHKEVGPVKSLLQLLWFLLGVGVMVLVLVIG